MSDQPQGCLKRKVTLRRKEEAAFTFTDRLKVRLLWQSETDPDWQSETELDFCLFFKKKDGEVGGVFSDEYRHCMSDRGALDQFPYILHLGDPRKPSEIRAMLANYPEGKMEEVEQINVASLEEIEQAYICIVNYGAAIKGRDVTFTEESGRVEITSDAGDNLEVQVDATEQGSVYLVCSILNREGNYALKNESRVMDLDTAFNEVPGFKLICNVRERADDGR